MTRLRDGSGPFPILERKPVGGTEVYPVNLARNLGDDETITGVTASVSGSGLVIEEVTFNGELVKVSVSGGTAGETYTITLTIATVDGDHTGELIRDLTLEMEAE